MAVPFVLPEDENSNEILLEIYECLTVLMRELQLRRSRVPSSSTISTVRNSMVPRRCLREDTSATRLSSLMTAARNLISLGSFLPSSDSEDSSCLEENSLKSFSFNLHLEVEEETESRNQDENVTRQRKPRVRSIMGIGLVSKLVPNSWSGYTIWTAMICVVGWHLLRTR